MPLPDDDRVALDEYVAKARALGSLLRRVTRYGPTSGRNFAELLETRDAEDGLRTALRFMDERFTFSDWNARANRVAHWAHAQGLKRGDVVALLMENRPEYLFVWSGLAKLGVVTALVNTNVSGSALEHALTSASLSRDRRRRVPRAARHRLALATDARASGPGPLRAARGSTRAAARRRARALPHFEPGSALAGGAPRGRRPPLHLHVRHDGRAEGCALQPPSLPHRRRRALLLHRHDARDVLYDVLPLYHTAGGVMLPAIALFSAATLVIRRRFSASAFWDDVRR